MKENQYRKPDRYYRAGVVISRALTFILLMLSVLLPWGISPWNTAVAETPQITDLRSGQLETASRLVIETSDPVPVSLLLLVDPHRLVVDFPSSRWRVEDRGASGGLSSPLLKGYRFGSPAPNISRLVIDLDGPAVPEQIFWLPPRNGNHRLVIDLVDRGETAFRVAALALQTNQNMAFSSPPTASSQDDAPGSQVPLPQPRPRPPVTITDTVTTDNGTANVPLARPSTQTRDEAKWVVFIDPGHGGKDPGAISIHGHKEKDITLKAAKELANQLEATGQIKVVLSRDRDQFLHLRKRIELARLHQADIFISLHADAAPSSKARGVSVFTLSDTASDKEAELLASRENKADLIGGPDLGATDPEITPALLGIFQREAMNQSSMFANELMLAFDDLPTLKRGHRFAGFAVLKSPDIPSVLIEMGFLSNSQDESYLVDASYRRKIMQGVTQAVLRFLENNNHNLPNEIAINP
jgi:N-acetylmuramoyl-L-alanine amidase